MTSHCPCELLSTRAQTLPYREMTPHQQSTRVWVTFCTSCQDFNPVLCFCLLFQRNFYTFEILGAHCRKTRRSLNADDEKSALCAYENIGFVLFVSRHAQLLLLWRFFWNFLANFCAVRRAKCAGCLSSSFCPLFRAARLVGGCRIPGHWMSYLAGRGAVSRESGQVCSCAAATAAAAAAL